jgi:hypothetical protein
MPLLSDLAEAPAALPAASRYTVACGFLYLIVGLLLLAWPGAVQTLFLDPPFAGQEAALVRLIGMLVAIVGWFYVFGGRTGGRQFVAATILDRLILVPVVLLPLAFAGVFPHLLITFAVLDPLLASVSWYLLSRGRTRDTL